MRALAIVWSDAKDEDKPAPIAKSSAAKKERKDREECIKRVQCARIAESCQNLGTTMMLHLDEGEPNGVSLDITGCARLFGKSIEEGEAKLAQEARSRAAALLGESAEVRVVIADGHRVARAVAIFGASAVRVIPIGRAASHKEMQALPIASLPLPIAARAWLSRLGISRVSDLARLPKKELGSRLGAAEKDVFSLADGEDRAPLVPYVPPSAPEETVELDIAIESLDALAFVMKTLADRMSARISGRGQAIAKMEIVLSLDVAALSGEKAERARAAGQKRAIYTETIILPAPLSAEKDLLVVLRAKMEQPVMNARGPNGANARDATNATSRVGAPIRAVTLRATELVEKPARELSLFSGAAGKRDTEGVLARLAGELSAEGCDVGELGLRDTWEARTRTELRAIGSQAKTLKKEARAKLPLVSSLVSARPETAPAFTKSGSFTVHDPAPEPTILLSAPIAVERRDITPVRFLSRVERIHWWQGARVAVDRVMSKVGDKLACVDIDRKTGAANITGYFD